MLRTHGNALGFVLPLPIGLGPTRELRLVEPGQRLQLPYPSHELVHFAFELGRVGEETDLERD